MSTQNSSAMPAPDAGSNPQPNLSVVPNAKRQPPHPGALTKSQEAEVTLALGLCATSLAPLYAAGLQANKVPASFITTLKLDAEAVQRKGREALNSTTEKEGCTAAATDAKDALLDTLRTIQSAARTEFADTDPKKLKDYLVGKKIEVSRPALENAAQTLIDQANQDRPANTNTEFITKATDQRSEYMGCKPAQLNRKGAAKQQRRERDEMIASIRERRKKIQRAIDTAFPPGQPGSAKARVEYRLPANRPYSY